MDTPGVKMRDTRRKEPQKTTTERVSKETTNICEHKFIDDMTLFMAWHNWYLHEQNRAMSCLLQAQYQTMSNLLNTTAQQPTTTTSSNFQENEGANERRLGFIAKIAPLKKRLAAEVIDFFLLLLVKLFVIAYCLGDQYIDRFQYVLTIDENTTVEDLQTTLMHALLLRLVAVAYEGYCISGTLPLSRGSTFGKRVMGLQVVRCDLVEDLDAEQERIHVIPGNEVGTLRSLLRATMKNTIISLFFPMLLPFHTMANHNRLIYDIAIGTIVIERL